MRKKTSDIGDISSEMNELVDILVEIALEQMLAAETQSSDLLDQKNERCGIFKILDK